MKIRFSQRMIHASLLISMCLLAHSGFGAVVGPPKVFTVGGTRSGPIGTVVLQNNGGNDLTLTANGAFAFTQTIASGGTYNVTVKTAPAKQTCAVVNGAGTIAGANVTNVAVTCTVLATATLQASPGVRNATLSWQDPSGVTSSNVYISSARNCDVRNYASCPDGALLVNVTSPLVIANLRNGQAYFFKVESVFPSGERTLSDEAGARPNVIAFDGGVEIITPAPDGSVYLAGAFSVAGITTGSAVPLNAQTGRLAAPDFPSVDGVVSAVAPDGTGGWYIGGAFTHVGGIPRGNLAHILANGTVDATFNPSANGSVSAIAITTDTIFVGGAFTVVGGAARSRLAAFSKVGVLLPWNPSANSNVFALAISGNTVYAGGRFSAVGGVSRGRLAAIDVNGTLLSWSPVAGPAPTNFVSALAVSGNTIYAGGDFRTVGGIARNFLAAIGSDGTVLPWDPRPNGIVRTLGVSGNTVYAGGSFDVVAATQRRRLAAVKADTGELLPWNPSPDSTVQTLVVSGSTIYIGGLFSNVGSTPRVRAAAIEANGVLLPWDPRLAGSVDALAVVGDTVYAGGAFMGVDAVVRSRLAALDANGALLPWNPGVDGTVTALLISGSTVYVGGGFTTIGGTSHPDLAAVGTNGVVIESFNPAASSTLDRGVFALAASGGMLYVGGFFAEHLATYFKVDAPSNAGQRVAWNPGIDGPVHALTMEGSSLYVGGGFTSINGISRQRLALLSASLDPLRPVLLAWEVRANGPVDILANGSGLIYASGGFTTLDNGFSGIQPRNLFGAMTGGAGIPAWPAQPDSFVDSMATTADTVYLAGNFTRIGASARKGLAAIRSNGLLDDNFRPDVTGSIGAVAVSGNKIYVGGQFTMIGGKPRGRFATLNPDGTVVD